MPRTTDGLVNTLDSDKMKSVVKLAEVLKREAKRPVRLMLSRGMDWDVLTIKTLNPEDHDNVFAILSREGFELHDSDYGDRFEQEFVLDRDAQFMIDTLHEEEIGEWK